MSDLLPAVADELEKNLAVFRGLLSAPPEDLILWRPAQGKWNLLEIVCHLVDEECDDFRTRVRWVLEHPGTDLPSVDPEGWVQQRHYRDRSYPEMTRRFFGERLRSLEWLRTLDGAPWDNTFEHPQWGVLSARMFLANWPAHDLLHMRQILGNQYHFLRDLSGEDLTYAGSW